MLGNLIFQDSLSRNGRGSRSTPRLRRLFLKRLRRVVDMRRERAPLLEPGASDLRLLDRAVYSTYCDCLDLGAGEEARAILREEWASAS